MANLRKQVKSRISEVLHHTSVDTFIGRAIGVSTSPLVICYHRVVQHFDDSATRAMPSLLVSTSMFEKQLDWLANHFDMVSLEEVLQSSLLPDSLLPDPLLPNPQPTGSERLPRSKGRRQASITFDDGYADFYWNALPILVKKKIPATVFVVTDLVGTAKLQTHDELYLLLSEWFSRSDRNANVTNDPLWEQLEAALALHSDPYNAARYLLAVFSQREVIDMMERLQARVHVSAQSLREFQSLSWSMLKSMIDQGVTIGSHTRSHVLLSHHDQQQVMDELRGSREVLETELGVPATFLAYPDGQFNERIASAAQNAGYTAALTICNHLSHDLPRYTVPRTVLWENACVDDTGQFSPAIMSCLVNGVFGLSSRCTQDHRVS